MKSLKVCEKSSNFVFKKRVRTLFPIAGLKFSCLQKVINCLKMTNCNRRPRYLLNVFQSSENVFHSRQDSHDGRQQVLNADFISYLFSRPIFFLICYGNFLTLTLHQHGYGIMYAINEYETKKKTKIT